jgi:hypothetical protein
MDQFVDRFNGCAIASRHFSRPSASILRERALQKTWQFELDTDLDLMCVEPRDYACAETESDHLPFHYSTSPLTAFIRT